MRLSKLLIITLVISLSECCFASGADTGSDNANTAVKKEVEIAVQPTIGFFNSIDLGPSLMMGIFLMERSIDGEGIILQASVGERGNKLSIGLGQQAIGGRVLLTHSTVTEAQYFEEEKYIGLEIMGQFIYIALGTGVFASTKDAEFKVSAFVGFAY